MPTKIIRLFAFSLLAVARIAAAQESTDPIDNAIVSVFLQNNEKVLCLNSDSSLPAVRKSVEAHFNQQAKTGVPNSADVARAVYTIFPCPFSPYREELRPASAKDIEGVWIYPETSQKLRFGPKSPMWSRYSRTPIKCESVAYYPGGELRSAQIFGLASCPFSKAADMEISRKNPKVAFWQYAANGIMKVSRTDIQDHIEEWEIFSVAKQFQFADIQFNDGDLVAYLRRERGNDFNAATVFRHLRRLQ